ncbi:dTDP-4-dehydrorhamnose reductase [Candidatus Binatus sp.]|uniref:dTDP-4-dehydrorhamnose reductase n=1 Tax=Candidatus Binatus sp. TaxID=2811406 RepID=UPI003BB10873
MKILIAGASGQLGTCLRGSLRGHQVVPLGRGELDITRLSQIHRILKREQPDLVINAAAFNDVDGAESQITSAYAGNALGPQDLAAETAELRIPLVHVSTDYVFDGSANRPYDEHDLPNPISVYGASKLAGEIAVRELNPRHYIVRTAWLYWESGKGFVLSMCANASKPELRVANDQIGSPTYVPHLADAIARLIETGAYGTYHIAGSGGVSRLKLVSEAFSLLNISTPLRPVSYRVFPVRARRPVYSVLTSVQEPRIALPPWQDGLAEFASRFAYKRAQAAS